MKEFAEKPMSPVEDANDLGESAYEVIRCPDSESDLEEVYEDEHPGTKPNANGLHHGLSKFAEAAGKRMRKLKRTWSLKKSDIGRNLRKYSGPVSRRPVFLSVDGGCHSVRGRPPEQNCHSVLKPSPVDAKSVIRHHGGPVVGGDSKDATTFYITLTIEKDEDEECDDEEGEAGLYGSKSTSTGMSFSSTSFDSVSNVSSVSGTRPPPPAPTNLVGKRRSKSQQLVRPREAPPAPPMQSVDDVPPPLPSSSPPELGVITETLSFHISESEHESSGSSDVVEAYSSSLFQTEPLYQFYDDATPSSSFSNAAIGGEDGMYELVKQPALQELEPGTPGSLPPCAGRPRPSAMDLTNVDGQRSLWTELPEVIHSGILKDIPSERKRLQEAMFEVVSSEASYLKSLNILIRHFVQSPMLVGAEAVISKRDYRILFSDIISVRQCSEKFLSDLEKRWQSSVLLKGLCQVVRDHAKDNFHVYVKYCSNQVYQDRIMNKLRKKNVRFVEALRQLESSPICQSLAMYSFLLLPMQRITRLPLLIASIFSKLDSKSSEYEPCKEALETLNKLVQECNESTRNMERMEEMLILSRQLDFKELKALPLISASRWLVRRGEATRIWWKENSEAKLTFGKRFNKQTYVLFLFTDLLAVTKRKSDDHYVVVDYCQRNLVQLQEVDSNDESIPCGKSLMDQGGSHLAWLTLLQSQESKTVEWLLSFPTDEERRSWRLAVAPCYESAAKPREKIYQAWDRPEMEVIRAHSPVTYEELELREGECVKVIRKLTDSGWYYAERQDEFGKTERGWVPMSVTKEIVQSDHNRAKNYKRRHEFLKYLSSSSIGDGP